MTVPTRQLEETVYVGHGPLVTAEVRIPLAASYQVQIAGSVAHCPHGPGIVRVRNTSDQMEHAFDVGVEDYVVDIVEMESAGQLCNTRRRLGRLH